MIEPVFTRNPEAYVRDINIFPHAIRDAAYFLFKRGNERIPMEECIDFVLAKVNPGGEFEVKDPVVYMLERGSNGDKKKAVTTFSNYIKDISTEGDILAPTFTVYTNPEKDRSILSEFIGGNVIKRAVAKKKEHQAKVDGNKIREVFHAIEQTCAKLDNNGISGAHASPSTILRNKSTHSTLTSTCRTVTSYGNTNNEKFLGGRRHYWCYEVTLANIISICRHTNLIEFEKVMRDYDLYYPNHQDIMDCINHSIHSYWKFPEKSVLLEEFVRTLSPIECAAFLYVGDMYHLCKHNDSFTRKFLAALSFKASNDDVTALAVAGKLNDPDLLIGTLDGDQGILVSLLCSAEMNGKDFKKLKATDPAGYLTAACTAFHLKNALEDYRPFIKAMYVTDNMPSSVANVQSIVREVVVGGDTDSTLFTTQWWTKWYVGKYDFSSTSCAIAAVTTYLTSQSVAHILAMCSANMGIQTKNIHRISMKNEYYFPVFVMTSRAKHYFAYQGAKEGIVFGENELEVKGVALRNSNVPAVVTKYFRTIISKVMDDIIKDVTIDPHWLLNVVYDQERAILNTIEAGKTQYLKRGQIKLAEHYSNPRDTKILSYDLWQTVFGPKYGYCDEPPYAFVKVNLALNNKTAFRKWLTNLKDQALATRLQDWMTRNGKDIIKTMYLPEHVVEQSGVPTEIVEAINKRQLVFEILESFYLLLEAMGFYMINKNLTVLVTDYYQRKLNTMEVPALAPLTPEEEMELVFEDEDDDEDDDD